MKSFFYFLCFVCICQASFSQSRFGIRGGLNIASQKYTLGYGENVIIKGEAIASFHIGGMSEIKLNRSLFLQPSLMLNGKGANFSELISGGNGIYSSSVKVRPYYIELPIILVAKTSFPGSHIKIYGGGGPSFGYGIFGKEKSKGSSNPVFYKGSKNRFDFGIDITGGMELPSGWQFSCHYIPGIANVSSDRGPEPWEAKNKVFALSVGYFFTK